MAKNSKKWADLSPWQRRAVLVLTAIEFALTTAAAVDLWFRPKTDIRGTKSLWWLGIFVQPVGPIAYLVFGRRSGRAATEVAKVEGP
jgi:hypothetical protein